MLHEMDINVDTLIRANIYAVALRANRRPIKRTRIPTTVGPLPPLVKSFRPIIKPLKTI